MPHVLTNPLRIERGVYHQGVDELKGLAIILVIYYHLCGVLRVHWSYGAECGVDVFAILSGYMLALNSAALPVWAFMRRRVFKIYPTYWVALSLFVLLRFGLLRIVGKKDILFHALGIHGLSPVYMFSINDSFWYITFILGMYLLFLPFRRWIDRPAILFTSGCLCAAAASLYYQQLDFLAGGLHLAPRVLSFFLGMAGAKLLENREIEVRVSALLVVGLACLVAAGWYTGVKFGYPAMGLAVIFVGVVLKCALYGRPFMKPIWYGLKFLGIYSYEIYLLHQPFIRDVNLRVLDSFRLKATWWSVLGGATIALGVVLGLSVLLHWATHRLRSTNTVYRGAALRPNERPVG